MEKPYTSEGNPGSCFVSSTTLYRQNPCQFRLLPCGDKGREHHPHSLLPRTVCPAWDQSWDQIRGGSCLRWRPEMLFDASPAPPSLAALDVSSESFGSAVRTICRVQHRLPPLLPPTHVAVLPAGIPAAAPCLDSASARHLWTVSCRGPNFWSLHPLPSNPPPPVLLLDLQSPGGFPIPTLRSRPFFQIACLL